jgi:hypothetical protein
VCAWLGSRRARVSSGGALITHWQSVWLPEGEGSETGVRQPCSALLICSASGPTKNCSIRQLAGLQALQGDFQDHNVILTWGNVELRGLEPLASCMPYNSHQRLRLSGAVWDGS